MRTFPLKKKTKRRKSRGRASRFAQRAGLRCASERKLFPSWSWSSSCSLQSTWLCSLSFLSSTTSQTCWATSGKSLSRCTPIELQTWPCQSHPASSHSISSRMTVWARWKNCSQPLLRTILTRIETCHSNLRPVGSKDKMEMINNTALATFLSETGLWLATWCHFGKVC